MLPIRCEVGVGTALVPPLAYDFTVIAVRSHDLCKGLLVGQQAALDDVVALAPAEEGFGADGIVVDGERGFAGLDPAHEEAVHVALAEAGEGHGVLGRPAGEAAETDFIIVLVFFARVAWRWRRNSWSASSQVKGGIADDICARFAPLLMTMCQ